MMKTVRKGSRPIPDERFSSSDLKHRDELRRKGFCDTCGIAPVQCYEIKKRVGGIIRDKVPLTIPGVVINGTCLHCHPEEDPDKVSGGEQVLGDRRGLLAKSHPTCMGTERQPQRQSGFRDLSKSVPTRCIDDEYRLSELRLDNDSNEHQSSHLEKSTEATPDSDSAQVPQDESDSESVPKDDKYVEEIKYNIFNEPVIVRKKMRKSTRRRTTDSDNESKSNPTGNRFRRATNPHEYSLEGNYSLEQSPRSGQQHSPQVEENFNNQGPAQLNLDCHSHTFSQETSTSQFTSRYCPMEEEVNSRNDSARTDATYHSRRQFNADDESLDALALLCANYAETQSPEEAAKFVPGGELNRELHLDDFSDDMSVLTLETHFRRSMQGLQQQIRKPSMAAISEESAKTSTGQQISMISHQIEELTVPFQILQLQQAVVAKPAQNVPSSPQLLALREAVGKSTQDGTDADEIDAVTLACDDAASTSTDLVLYCLTTLWVLAQKSSENKRLIAFEGETLRVIIEAMQVHSERSAEIQTSACGVLWSLSTNPYQRKRVAEAGGCDAILNAMSVYAEEDNLWVMAFCALKELSFSNFGKTKIRSCGALSLVPDAMRKHERNPVIQSEGCVILGNIAVNNEDDSVVSISEGGVGAIIQAIINHPDSLEVHDAACFTLMTLASSAENAALIRKNDKMKDALDLAFEKHPQNVGKNIFTLMLAL